MQVGEICNREVIVIDKESPLREATALMRRYHVGDLVVVENKKESVRPIGILTDRDIVIKVLAENLALDTLLVADVMSYELATIRVEDHFMEALKLMKSKGIRRVPVVNGYHELIGILTVDDLLELLAEQLNDLASLVTWQRKRERQLCV